MAGRSSVCYFGSVLSGLLCGLYVSVMYAGPHVWQQACLRTVANGTGGALQTNTVLMACCATSACQVDTCTLNLMYLVSF